MILFFLPVDTYLLGLRFVEVYFTTALLRQMFHFSCNRRHHPIKSKIIKKVKNVKRALNLVIIKSITIYNMNKPSQQNKFPECNIFELLHYF